jgi:hypothetical protein
MFCENVSETSNSNQISVYPHLCGLFRQYFKTVSTYKDKKITLKDVNASFGFASENSKPDFIHTTKAGA